MSAPADPVSAKVRTEWAIAGIAFAVGAATCSVTSWAVVGSGDAPELARGAASASATGGPGASATGASATGASATGASATGASATSAAGAAGLAASGSAAVASASPPKRAGPPRFKEQLDVTGFLRGNLHTHSKRSDGDSQPEEVYAYYRDHGYAFLVLTDHNTRTDPTEFAGLSRSGFVMIPGEEVTTTAAGKPVHVNAICTRRTIGGGRFETAREALTWAVAEVKAQGAIALVNHPNFDWALSASDLPAARGAELLEVWSGHPYVHTEGDLLRPSHEAIWTQALDEGEAFAGVAVDDMHHLSPRAKEPAARPRRGWVEVFGREVKEAAICDGLRRGRLYASSGPKLSRLRVEGAMIGVTVVAASRVEFVGAEGAVLAEVSVTAGKEARYELRGGERYVRARITGRDGQRAWTQAYRTE